MSEVPDVSSNEVTRSARGENIIGRQRGLTASVFDDVEVDLDHPESAHGRIVEGSLGKPGKVVEVTDERCPPVADELLGYRFSTAITGVAGTVMS